MKILICSSKAFYDKIPEIQQQLEAAGHEVSLPNCFDDPGTENTYRDRGGDAHAAFKARMFRQSENVISSVDGVLVLNFEKGGIQNYVGGATFLEMYDAFRLGKKLYLYNPVPTGILEDEICGFSPMVLDGDLSRVL